MVAHQAGCDRGPCETPQYITCPVRRYARESRAQSPTVESVLEMEIDEIKRCAWPWAACTVLGHRGAWARLARRGGGLAVPPRTSPLSARARRRSGSRSRPGGMAERSAGAAPRPGGRVGSFTRMPLPCAVGRCGRDNRGRAPGRASGMPAAWPHRVAHRASWAGAWGQLRGAGAALAVAVRSWAGYVVYRHSDSRPPARSPAFGPFTDTVRPPSACPSLPRRRPSRLPRSRSPAPGPSGAGWP